MNTPNPTVANSNFDLITIFLKSLLDKGFSEEEMNMLTDQLSDTVNQAIWAVLYANSNQEFLKELESKDESVVKTAVNNIIKTGQNNPKVQEEIQELLKNILVDLNNELPNIKEKKE